MILFRLKRIKKMLTILIIVLAVIGSGFFVFLNQAKFGRLPAGDRLARIESSPHYQNGRFRNLIPTLTQTEGVGFVEMMTEYLRKKERLTPAPDHIWPRSAAKLFRPVSFAV